MRLLKWCVYLIVMLVVVAVIGAVIFLTLLNPNDYKKQISALVKEKTGRELVINGSIERSIIPWLGLRVHDAHLSNGPGFTDRGDFIHVGEADIRVQLLPLFSKHVDIERISLKNLQAHFIKDKDGRTNWQDLFKPKAITTTTTSTTIAPDQPVNKESTIKSFAVSVTGIEVHEAQINWDDAQTNQAIVLQHLELNSQNVSLKNTFPLTMAFDLASTKPAINGHFTLDTQINLDTAQKLYDLNKVKFTAQFAGKIPAIAVTAAQIAVDLHQQIVDVKQAVISSDDVSVNTEFKVQNLLDQPFYKGSINSTHFNLKAFLNNAGINYVGRDPQALQRVAVALEFNGTRNSLNLNPLRIDLDETTVLTGSVSITDFATHALQFALALNEINVDRYIPFKTQSVAAPSTITAPKPIVASVVPVTTPAGVMVNNKAVEFLRAITLNGNLTIGSLTLSQTVVKNVLLQLSGRAGVIQMAPIKAQVYQGNIAGQAVVDLSGDLPKYAVQETLSGIQLSQLTRSDRLIGTTDITANLTTQGQNKPALLQNLNGNLKFIIKKGSFLGANIPYEVDRVLALVKKKQLPAPPAANQTDFDQFMGTGTITNGLLTNNDLLIQSARFKITGEGTANLVSQQLNYHLLGMALQPVTNEQGETVQTPSKTSIPLLVTGTFNKPIFAPDPQAIAAMLLKEKVNNLQEKINTQIAPLKEKAGEFINNLLQN